MEKDESDPFQARYGSWAVIAGGSDGIGAAFAEELSRRGLNIVLVARNEEKLAAKSEELSRSSDAEIRTLSIDLTRADLAETIDRETLSLDVGLLIYNAGSGRDMGPFLDRSADTWLRQVDLACRGPLALAHAFAKRFRDRGRGGIILMSSLSSLSGSAYTATYAAAKAFDTILGEGLWQELAPHGIDVLSCLAGATDTETYREDTGGSPDAMRASDVAVGSLDFLGRGPHYVPGDGNRAGAAAIWPVPRIPLVNSMSQINAKNFGLPFNEGQGREFSD